VAEFVFVYRCSPVKWGDSKKTIWKLSISQALSRKKSILIWIERHNKTMNKFYCGIERCKKFFSLESKQQKCHTKRGGKSWQKAYKNALEMMLAIYAKPSQFDIHSDREMEICLSTFECSFSLKAEKYFYDKKFELFWP
jgi:hypothetical protein